MKATTLLHRVLLIALLISCATTSAQESGLDLSAPSDDETQLRRQVYALHQQAAGGDRYASARLAEWKRRGVGNSRLYVNVAKLEKLAEEREGDLQLKSRLGLAYIRGEGGVTRDVDRGLAMLEEASEAGNRTATVNLGAIYARARETPELGVDMEKAKLYYQRLADRGDPQGFLELGWIYRDVEGDLQRGTQAYLRAAELGSAEGLWQAGASLRKGDPPVEQMREGFELIVQAAEMGHLTAARHAAVILLVGHEYAERDEERAIHFLDQVLSSGSPDDHERLLRLLDGDLSPGGSSPALTTRLSGQTQSLDPNVARRQQALGELDSRKGSDPAIEKLLDHLNELRAQRVAAAR